MISQQKSWIKTAINLQGSVIYDIWPRIVVSMAFAALITLIYHGGATGIHQPALASLIPAIVLGLLLVFRTNTSYDRFWEGRKVIGGIIIFCRSLSRQIWINIPEKTPQDTQEKMGNIRLMVGFLIATKLHLRKEIADEQLKSIISEEQYVELKNVNHMPLRVAKWIGDYFRQLYDRNYIDTIQLSAYNQLLDQMVLNLTAAERILNTPLPPAYSIHLKQLLLIYCVLLPFQLVESLGWLTIPAVGVISFALLGIEAIGLEIENPFGYDPNDLPLDNLCNGLRDHTEELMSSDSRKEYALEEEAIATDVAEGS